MTHKEISELIRCATVNDDFYCNQHNCPVLRKIESQTLCPENNLSEYEKGFKEGQSVYANNITCHECGRKPSNPPPSSIARMNFENKSEILQEEVYCWDCYSKTNNLPETIIMLKDQIETQKIISDAAYSVISKLKEENEKLQSQLDSIGRGGYLE